MSTTTSDRRRHDDAGAETRATAEAFLQRLGDGDAEAVADLFADHVDWDVPGDPRLSWTGTRSRAQDVASYFHTLWAHLEPGASVVELDELVVEGGSAIALLDFSHVARETGRRFSTPAVLRLRVRDGVIVRLRLYEDTLAVSEAWDLAGKPHELEGRRVLVTGGSRGIGAGIVDRLASVGAEVVATARSTPAATSEGVHFVVADATSRPGIEQLTVATLDLLGGVDVIVNNAGAARPFPAGSLSIDDEAWQDSLDVNFLAAMRLNAALLPQMLERGSGVIVNIASSAALDVPAALLHYGAAKAALIAYSKGLATELAPSGIRVNTITPGSVRSPGADATRAELAEAFGIDAETLGAKVPIGRLGVPQDIAEAVAYLISDRASFVTGANVIVDGGQLTRP